MKGTKIIRIDGYIGMYRPSADDHCIPNILPLYIYIYILSLCSSRWFYRAYLINDTLIINFPFTRTRAGT